VVADDLERTGDSGEEACAVVLDRSDAAVHRLRRPLDVAALDPAHPLQPEADAEQRALAVADHLGTDAEILSSVRPAGTRGDDDVVELEPLQLLPALLVVTDDERLASVHLRQQLEEVVGEGVVVVDQQRAHHGMERKSRIGGR
jgi:hypothetical protein